jgi:hypothetical protein
MLRFGESLESVHRCRHLAAYFTDGFVVGAVTVTVGGVVAVGEGNNIAVLSAATGVSFFTYTGAGQFWGPLSIADGTLYEGDMAGNLYALTTN